MYDDYPSTHTQHDFEDLINISRIIAEVEEQLATLFRGMIGKTIHYLEDDKKDYKDPYEEFNQYSKGIANKLARYETFLSNAISRDFISLPDDAVQAGSFVTAYILDKNNKCAAIEKYHISTGHVISEDITILERYNYTIRNVLPFEPIGQALLGKQPKEFFTYTLNNKKVKGIIVEVKYTGD